MNKYPAHPGSKGTAETSQQAATAIASKAGTLRRSALWTLSMDLLEGGKGLTADEVARRCQVDKLAMRPRLSELKARGLIEDTGQRRANTSGKTAVVWTIVDNPQPHNTGVEHARPTGEGTLPESSQQSDLFRGGKPGGQHKSTGIDRAYSSEEAAH